jgi:hypothetical protein
MATAATAGELHAATSVFLIEEIERRKTDVGHFLFAENEALIGRGVVGLRDIGSGHRGCRCATNQRKAQSGGTQCLDGAFACVLLRRNSLDPWHGGILQKLL